LGFHLQVLLFEVGGCFVLDGRDVSCPTVQAADPSDPSKYMPVGFEDGTIRPVYLASCSGGHDLITMFPESAPGKHP
jgi:hypothetical protein